MIQLEDDKQIVEFFKAVSKGIRRYGIKKIVEKLKTIESENADNSQDKLKNHIINVVCKTMSVQEKDIYSYQYRGKVTIARNLIIVFLKEYLSLADNEIGLLLGGRCRQVAYNTMKDYNSLDRTNSIDYNNFYVHYDNANQQIKQFVDKITKPN
jgi:chromosomal replication initiation ATPase DnaA